jgi:hypothetical protein
VSDCCRARGLSIQVSRAIAHGKNTPYLPRLEAFRSYFGVPYNTPIRARFAADSIASTILE